MLDSLGGRKFVIAVSAEILVTVIVVVLIIVLKPTFDQATTLLQSFMAFTGANGIGYYVSNVAESIGTQSTTTTPTTVD